MKSVFSLFFFILFSQQGLAARFSEDVCIKSIDCSEVLPDPKDPTYESLKAACLSAKEVCQKHTGIIETSNGQKQAYHPGDPRYVYCARNFPEIDVNSKAFHNCVFQQRESKTKSTPAQMVACSLDALENCKSKDSCESKNGAWTEGNCQKPAANNCSDLNNLMCNKNELDQKYLACISALRSKVEKCQVASNTALEECNSNEENPDILSGIDQLFKNNSLGSYESCLNAGLASQTGWYSLESAKNKCDSQLAECNSSCANINEEIETSRQNTHKICKTEFQASMGQLANPNFEAYYVKHYSDEVDRQISELVSEVTKSKASCGPRGEAYAKRADLLNSMDSLNESAKQANQCQCQLSSESDCVTSVGPADCAIQPSLSGCSKAVVNCLTSSSPECKCIKNPALSECSKVVPIKTTASSTASLSEMASAPNDSDAQLGNSNSIASMPDDANLNGLNLASSESRNRTSSETESISLTTGVAPSAGATGDGRGAANTNSTNINENNESSTVKKLAEILAFAKPGVTANISSKDKVVENPTFKNKNNGFKEIDANSFRPGVRGIASMLQEIHKPSRNIFEAVSERYRYFEKNHQFLDHK